MDVQCEFCVTEKALIYCKSDSAKLCLNCDVYIHSKNPLSQRHMRAFLCEKCFLRPMVYHCLNEKISFCQECLCTGLGHRLQNVNPYSGCPLPSNFPKNMCSILEPPVSNWVFPFADTFLQEGEDSNGSSSSMVPQNQNFEYHSPSIFSMEPPNLPKVLEEEFSSLDLCGGINFDDVPLSFNVDDAPLSFNASDDITGYSSLDHTNYYDYDDSTKGENDISLSSLLLPVLSENVVPSMSVSMMSNITRESRTTEYQDCGISPGFLIDSTWDSNVESSFNPKPREEILKRYKHKKSKRMFGKQIRYASRKARADTRIRVKGRFVKSGEKFDYDQSLMI